VNAWVWVIIAIAVIVIVAAVWAASAQRRRVRVRQRFGPEYDEALSRHPDRRAAEADLRDRTRRREELDIRSLSAGARDRYGEQWRAIQAGFVDQPGAAITNADALLDRVLRDRGYPVDDFDAKAELVSVDHPTVVSNYRAARLVHDRRHHSATTEELRQAFLHYRSLFDELLVDEDARDVSQVR
jgi:hypothetical protein